MCAVVAGDEREDGEGEGEVEGHLEGGEVVALEVAHLGHAEGGGADYEGTPEEDGREPGLAAQGPEGDGRDGQVREPEELAVEDFRVPEDAEAADGFGDDLAATGDHHGEDLPGARGGMGEDHRVHGGKYCQGHDHGEGGHSELTPAGGIPEEIQCVSLEEDDT